MEVLPVIIILWLAFSMTVSLRRFLFNASLAAFAFWLTSIDVITEKTSLTLVFASAYSLVRLGMLRTDIGAYVAALTGFAVCAFWLSITEFKDGYALSHISAAIAAGIYSYVVFSPDDRQAFCIAMLVGAVAVTYTQGIALRAYEILSAFFTALILTENYLPTSDCRPFENFASHTPMCKEKRFCALKFS